MKSFTEAVRSGEIKGPQQVGFSIALWDKAFHQRGLNDSIDKELHASGTWFHHQFAQIRSITEEASMSFHWSSPKDRLRAFAGYATLQWRNLRVSSLKKLEAAKNHPTFISELKQVQVSGPFLTEADPAATIELLVDALRFPLSLDYRPSEADIPFGSGTPAELVAFTKLALAGQHYHLLAQRWLDCLWNDFRVVAREQVITIEPRDLERESREAISGFRHESLLNEATYHASSLWEHTLNDNVKKHHLDNRKVLSVYKRGDRFRVKSAAAGRFPEQGSRLGFFRLAVTAEYTDSLLQERFSALNGLSVGQVMEAYDLVSQMPGQIAQFLASDKGRIDKPEEFTRWAPIFSRTELTAALKDAMHLSQPSADWLVAQMIFPLSVREELWFRPFLHLGGDDVVLITPAVDGVNFARLLDSILKSTPEADARIGPRFEKYVHEKIIMVTRQSVLTSATVVSRKRNILLRAAEGDEEIDLAFQLGNHLFICELKSSRFPCDPIEHLNYRQKLDEASEQALRKVERVRSNLDQFLEQAEMMRSDTNNEVSVHPLIITSIPLFAGWEWRGVPVCDWFILRRYWADGQLELLATPAEDGALKASVVHKFYDSSTEAVENVLQYFCHAPQVKVFEPFVEIKAFPLPKIGDIDLPTAYVAPIVQLPHDALRSFASKATP